MSTFKFTASIMVAIDQMIITMYHGPGRLLSWSKRIPFFSEITGSPIVESQVPSPTFPAVILNKVTREVSFSRYGKLFAVVSLEGYKHVSQGEQDNGSSWSVKKIRLATEWVGSKEDPDPKNWTEIQVDGPGISGVL